MAVRDLQWVISSPLLLDQLPHPNLFADPETTTFLKNLQSDPAPLLEYLAGKETKALGIYFEQLILFWLDNLPSISLIGSNIQVFQDKRTIGEIDVIFEHGQKIFHWELAVKFYLNIGSGLKADQFVGPRLKDTLGAKLSRIFDHQIPLVKTPEGKSKLAKLNIDEVVSSAVIKGILFQPCAPQFPPANRLPTIISRNYRHGSWITVKMLENLEDLSFTHFLVMDKIQWFTDYYYPEEVTSGNIVALKKRAKEQIKDRNMPIMVCLFRSKNSDILKSDDRLFIVPDDWPRLAAESHNC
ncbi:DUF1853 family protein [Sneathiella marina]|uniref:DUF1853 family protein n=1 Tax=Sneathiella marina TaxID=2950108 RepID=A0ABY4W876_9PROT|nr:DUF1853 family protein [Sneathiella marina]USG63046.1 DUF1853 family protein [Sneathiella marina]